MNRQERLTRFQSNICEGCRLCEEYDHENFEAEFCFEKFEEDAAIFVEEVYPRLLLVSTNLGKQGVKEKDLYYAFCDTGVCFVGDSEIARYCTKTSKCLRRLSAQAKQMSKKKHKRRAARIYSRKQFSDIICGQCGICPYYTEPEFCFEEVYKHNPKGFMEKVYPRLLELKKNYRSKARHVSSMPKEDFKKLICCSCVCFDTKKDCEDCCDSSDCYDTFMDSTCGLHVVADIKETKKKKKEKNKYIPVPYATFFSSSKKGFQEEIQRILYGNNNKKQNTDKEMPGEFVAEINSGSSDGEPEVPGSVETGTEHLGN
jgi:hypothetical protein